MTSATQSERTPDTPVRRRSRNPRGQGDRLRDDLIRAALEIAAQTGNLDAVTLRGVARQVGVSPTAVYRHFDDLDDLLAETCNACMTEFAQLLERFAENAADPFEEVRLRGRGYLAFAQAERGKYRVLFSNPHVRADGRPRPFEGSPGEQTFNQLVELARRCQVEGARPGEDPRDVAIEIWTWIHGIVDLHLTHPQVSWPPVEVLFDRAQERLGLTRPSHSSD